MIVTSAGTLWVMMAVWLAVVVCAFMFGWYAQQYTRAEQAAVDRAVRRHPSTRHQPDHLPRPGRLPLDAMVRVAQSDTVFHGDDLRFRALIEDPAPSRWWPALERHARADTAPFSAVELSNWEARAKRDTDAWLHERGL